jgi:hypothetical protein
LHFKLLPILGSLIKTQRPEKLSNQEIKRLTELSKKYKSFQTIIEPKNRKQEEEVRKHGFRQSKSPYLPSKTLHLDLTKSKKALFSQLKRDTRYTLRKTKDLRICSLDKIDEFHTSFKNAKGFTKYTPSKKELSAMLHCFKNDCLFLTTPNGSAGAIFLKTESIAYYWQAFTSKIGRKELAQYKIVWAGIHWAKKAGCKIFDFEGIYDERFPNKSWLGFTHFKKSFGGSVVEHPGAFVKTKFF